MTPYGSRLDVAFARRGVDGNIVDQDVALGQIKLHRGLRRDFGEGPVVGQDRSRLDLAEIDVPIAGRTPHAAEGRVIELSVEVILQRRLEPLDIVVDVGDVRPRAFQQLDILLLQVIDEHIEELLVIQRPASPRGSQVSSLKTISYLEKKHSP